MSNALAVASVTAVLAHVLDEALAAQGPGGVEGVHTTTLRPDMLSAADGAARGPNVFLYHVTPNASWQGSDLPTRRQDGSLVNVPRQAVDLHYLLSFSGDEAAQEPQRLLGLVATTLAAAPVLTRETVKAAIARNPGTYLEFSDLADQVDLVRFSMEPLGLEELSRLWATFAPTPYRLSITYLATVVLLEPPLVPSAARPVRVTALDVAPARLPVVARVRAASAPDAPITAGTRVRVEGRSLRGPVTSVRIAGADLTPDAVADSAVELLVPATVPAGVLPLQVVHRRPGGLGLPGAESNAVPITVRPAIVAPVTLSGNEVTVRLDPPVRPGQRVLLLLDALAPTGSHVFAAPPAASASNAVTVPTHDVAPGEYLVRVQVDGVQSVPGTAADGRSSVTFP